MLQNMESLTYRSPLPKVQLALVCFLRLLDPLNFTQIFPYVNQFMNDLHVTDDPSKAGFYSGLLESSFALCQLLAIYPWGFLSDSIGRRPVILVGVMGLALSTLLFGLSQSFPHALAARSLAGLFSGNVAVIPSVLCDITDRSNQSFAFAFFGVWWPVGAIIGPLVGGVFSHPVSKYPRFFDYPLLVSHPYFLPSFIVSVITAVGLVVNFIWLKETLPAKALPAIRNRIDTYGATNNDYEPPSCDHSSIRELLSIPVVNAICISGCAMSFISTAFDVVFVLFCYSPIQRGGLGFSTSQIGYALASSGLISALLQLLVMPVLLRRFDHARLYHFCMSLWSYIFMALPPLNVLARRGLDEGTGKLFPRITMIIWVWIAFILSMARIGLLAYSVNILLVKAYCPSPSSLGSTYALVQFFICLSRAISPVFISLAFTMSEHVDIFWGYGWAFVMTVICISSCYFSKRIVVESAKLQ